MRPADHDDADALAELYLDARAAAVPAIPASVHPPADVRTWVRSWFGDRQREVWLAESAGDPRPAGLLLLEGDWLHSLYVRPELTGQGIGAVLLETARACRPDGLGLWVFESNAAARRFYTRHGFGEVRRTDGAGNEEHAPDVELRWPAPTVAVLRAEVDDLDDQVALLLDHRAGLVRRIQQLKPVGGQPGRDHAREDEIARRMARSAPLLGADRVRRIMAAVIAACLDVHEQGTTHDGQRPAQHHQRPAQHHQQPAQHQRDA